MIQQLGKISAIVSITPLYKFYPKLGKFYTVVMPLQILLNLV